MLNVLLCGSTILSTGTAQLQSLVDRFVLSPVEIRLVKGNTDAAAAAKVAARYGRVVRFDRVTQRWIVDVSASHQVDRVVKALELDKRVSFVQAGLPTLDSETHLQYRVDVLEAGLEEYKKRYQEFLKVAPPRPDGSSWRSRAPRQEALGSQLWRLKRRAFPRKTVDIDAYRKAEAQMQKAAEARFVPLANEKDMPVTFESIGPVRVTPHSRYGFGLGDVIGRINDIAIDKNSDGTWYVATAGGGIWKTTDFGNSWTPLSEDWPGLNTSCVTIDPNNSQVIYAGGGDFPRLFEPVFLNSGLRKSTDGGSTWVELGFSTFLDRPIADITVHPDNSNIVFACVARVYQVSGNYHGGTGQLYRSMDGGVTWSVIGPEADHYYNVEFSKGPIGARTMYVISGNAFRVSNNNGNSFVTIANVYGFSQGEVEASKVSNNVAYMTNQNGEVWKTIDHGTTWGRIDTGLSSAPGFSLSQSNYNLALGIGSRPDGLGSTDTLYVGQVDLHFANSSAGNSWSTLGGPGYSNNGLIHVDIHAVEVFPNNGLKALVASDGGLYELTYDPSTQAHSVVNRNGDLSIKQIYGADYHPTNPNFALTGAQDNGSAYSDGTLHDWKTVTSYDGGHPIIYGLNPNIQLTSRQNLGMTASSGPKLFRTENNWADFTEVVGPTPAADESWNFICPIVKDPGNSSNVYIGTNYLYRYRVDFNTFSARLGNQNFGGRLESIVVAPGNSARIYVGTHNGRIWVTTNSGTSWTELNTTNLPDRSINSIAVHPTDQTEILVGLGGTGAGPVYRCPNTASVTWENVSGTDRGALPQVNANVVMFDPHDPEFVAYVGTDLGLYITTDGRQSWSRFGPSAGMPNAEVTDLDFVPGTDYLNVATYGRGIFRLRLPEPVFATSMSITGNSSTGTFTDLRRDDSAAVSIQPTYPERQAGIVIFGTCPVASPVEMDLLLRSKHIGSGNLREYVDVYNYATNQWVNFYSRPLNGFTYDQPVAVSLTGLTSSYIQTSSRAVAARVRVAQPGTQGDWNYSYSVEEFHFRIIR